MLMLPERSGVQLRKMTYFVLTRLQVVLVRWGTSPPLSVSRQSYFPYPVGGWSSPW